MEKIVEHNFQILKASMDNMNILINRFDNIKDKEGDKDQMEKKGHVKRTRANTRNPGDIKGREMDELKNFVDNMKQMAVYVEDIIKIMQLSWSFSLSLCCPFAILLLSLSSSMCFEFPFCLGDQAWFFSAFMLFLSPDM